MTFDPEQTAREVGCWLLGHDPIPKWDGEDPWCARCKRYVPSEESRAGPVWERLP